MFRTTPSSRNTGFSLMELMIVVAIIGILAAVAFPSYQNSVIKGNRANAKSFLMDVTQRQQQFLLDNRSYAGTVAALNVTVPPDASKFYTFAVTITPAAAAFACAAATCTNPGPCFTITATPKAGTKQAADGALCLSNKGEKLPLDKW